MSEVTVVNSSFSPEIGKITLAVSKLQGEIVDVFKDKKAYNYLYADLSSVLEISRPLLAKHKLAIFQLPGSANEKVTVETILAHESGEWIRSSIEMIAERGKGMSLAQSVGSTITYARRYALTAMLGIAQTDNDAAVVSQSNATPIKTEHNKPPMATTSKAATSKVEQKYASVAERDKGVETLTELLTLAPENKFAEWFSNKNYENLNSMTDTQVIEWILILKKKINEARNA